MENTLKMKKNYTIFLKIIQVSIVNGLDGGANRQTPELRTAEYYKKRPCKELVGMAAEILEAEMLEWDRANEGK